MSYDDYIKEVATVKDRTLTLQLSYADCKRIAVKAGINGLTVANILENFIGDLIDGTHSNGSDERMYAEQWFDRCSFGKDEENSLLGHLLDHAFEPEEYLELLDNIEEAEKCKKEAEKHPEDYDAEEISFIDGDIETWNENIKYMEDGWKLNEFSTREEEISKLRDWRDEYKKLIKPPTVYEKLLCEVSKDGDILKYLSPELRSNRIIVNLAVKNKGTSLAFASTELKDDPLIVLTAVSNDGFALAHASRRLKSNREIVLAAVKQNGAALESAGLELRNDREIVLEAYKNSNVALCYASEEMQKEIENMKKIEYEDEAWELTDDSGIAVQTDSSKKSYIRRGR